MDVKVPKRVESACTSWEFEVDVKAPRRVDRVCMFFF